MDNNNKDIIALLSSQAFCNLANSRNIKIAELDAIIALLIKAKVSFDISFTPGTGRIAEAAELSIFLNPATTLNFTLNLQSGSSLLSGTTTP